ncbi:unnamed protein product [Linum tenue]|uniref:Uncharacterized protein n=1 Tax=Linum tenue TaxID=586396 RepID=A0AAV0IMF7_9ROSI|nr:unnamed protein product [Linum tenue]
MGAVEPSLDELLEERKRMRNPLVPIGCIHDSGSANSGASKFQKREFTAGTEVDESSRGCSRSNRCSNGWDCRILWTAPLEQEA